MRTIFDARLKIRQEAHIFRPVERQAYAPIGDDATDIAKALPRIIAQIPRRPWLSCNGAAAWQIKPRFGCERGYSVTGSGTLKAVIASLSRKRFMLVRPPPALDLLLKA
jgi:hypothetical protein